MGEIEVETAGEALARLQAANAYRPEWERVPGFSETS
jgi:hypothetical protein